MNRVLCLRLLTVALLLAAATPTVIAQEQARSPRDQWHRPGEVVVSAKTKAEHLVGFARRVSGLCKL